MKIYFAGSIRGGREHQEWYDCIIHELSIYGEVLTEFVADKNLSSYGQTNLTDEQIYLRDIEFIKESDSFIADITVPSLGIGYEIAYAERLSKKIYCLYYQEENKRISAMIVGNPNCKVLPYKNKEEISKIVESIFK